ncbi:hypothetical protein GYMLUDRAFT_239241 [Collybiopsis luxurians FD-317 M1]|nr:hypothetical protein GYMLUDRAFT_239241 [Collybiopsis luxurians FD-317 M1]
MLRSPTSNPNTKNIRVPARIREACSAVARSRKEKVELLEVAATNELEEYRNPPPPAVIEYLHTLLQLAVSSPFSISQASTHTSKSASSLLDPGNKLENFTAIQCGTALYKEETDFDKHSKRVVFNKFSWQIQQSKQGIWLEKTVRRIQAVPIRCSLKYDLGRIRKISLSLVTGDHPPTPKLATHLEIYLCGLFPFLNLSGLDPYSEVSIVSFGHRKQAGGEFYDYAAWYGAVQEEYMVDLPFDNHGEYVVFNGFSWQIQQSKRRHLAGENGDHPPTPNLATQLEIYHLPSIHRAKLHSISVSSLNPALVSLPPFSIPQYQPCL